MSTKAAFISALGGATAALGQTETVTFTNAANTVSLTSHGLVTDDGPLRFSSTGQLPAELAPQKATNGLAFTPGTIADDVVEIDGVYYQWAADPTTGTPDGSVGDPYLVDVGADDEESLTHLVLAINATGVGGTDYSAEIASAHSTVEATASDATTVALRARTAGTDGNSITLSVSGDDGVAADAATFSGGTDSVDYYAIKVDDDTIQVSLTEGGIAVTFTDDGTGTHSMGPTVQGLADAIDNALTNRLTFPGNRSQTADENIRRFWEDVVAAIL